MTIAIILLIAGLSFIFAEFYLPGGIIGAIGGILFVISIVWSVRTSDSLVWALVFIAAAFALLICAIKFALWNISRSRTKDGIYNVLDQEGYQASSYKKDLIGKRGEALSDLHPSGFIMLGGQKEQAVSQSGYIKKGDKIEVISGTGAHLVVKKIKEEK